MNKTITQAYKIVPWRGQMQWLGTITMALIAFSLVASIYLTVSSRAAIAGRELQDYQSQRSEAIESIAQLQTDLALITSSTEMEQRAKRLGFKEVNPGRFTYMVIPGYGGKPAASLAPMTVTAEQVNTLPVKYTESIWEWMYGSFIQPVYGQ